jgi:hypothetical protein
VVVSGQFNYTKGAGSMPFLLSVLLSFQGSTHLLGVGSFSYIPIDLHTGIGHRPDCLAAHFIGIRCNKGYIRPWADKNLFINHGNCPYPDLINMIISKIFDSVRCLE